ncbi:MAG: hypothetical protein P8Y99_14830 [Calditrichaceae bacterium]
MLVINPSIFKINSELNKLIDLDRKYPIQFSYPSKQSDLIEIYYSPEQFSIESQPNNVIENGKYGRVVFKGNYITDGKIVYNRDCTLKKTKISPVDYSDITKLRSALEKSENQNLILKKL